MTDSIDQILRQAEQTIVLIESEIKRKSGDPNTDAQKLAKLRSAREALVGARHAALGYKKAQEAGSLLEGFEGYMKSVLFILRQATATLSEMARSRSAN